MILCGYKLLHLVYNQDVEKFIQSRATCLQANWPAYIDWWSGQATSSQLTYNTSGSNCAYNTNYHCTQGQQGLGSSFHLLILHLTCTLPSSFQLEQTLGYIWRVSRHHRVCLQQLQWSHYLEQQASCSWLEEEAIVNESIVNVLLSAGFTWCLVFCFRDGTMAHITNSLVPCLPTI